MYLRERIQYSKADLFARLNSLYVFMYLPYVGYGRISERIHVDINSRCYLQPTIILTPIPPNIRCSKEQNPSHIDGNLTAST